MFKKVYVEITNICGLQCSFCPPAVLPRRTMPLPQFEAINAELVGHTRELYYHLLGDPLVVSNLGDYLDISHRFGLRVNLTTSGFHVRETLFGTLVHPAVKQINFSLNSFNANETRLSLEEYLSPLLAFSRYKLHSPANPFVNFRLWNLDESRSAYDFNRALFERLNLFFESSLDIDAIYEERPRSIRLENKVRLHFDDYFEWPSLQSSYRQPEGFCHGLSGQLGIHADGTVVPCCLDKDAVVNLGNLTTQSLESLLSSERARSIVEGFRRHTAVEELCQKCQFKERFC